MITLFFKSVTYIFTAVAFVLELPFRLISLISLIIFFVVGTLLAPIMARIFKRGFDITNWVDYTLYFKGGLYHIVYNSYKKALGL